MSSFNFPRYHTLPTPGGEQPPLQNSAQSDPISSAEKGVAEVSLPHIITTRFLLFAFQITLLFGLGLAVVGYIGCFSVVQASPRKDSRGALAWLVCEALLAVLRTLVWGANPKWDDAKLPIALEKVATTTENKTEDMKKVSSYGIDWMLSSVSVTANDMHALIVGINKFGEFSSFHDLDECVPGAERIASYLKDTLLVPQDQIVTFYDSQATKEGITQALRDLSDRTSVVPDAPIIIYLASHIDIRYITGKRQVCFIPHCGASEIEEDTYIPYDSIVDMIGRIADNKTDNIVSANFTLGA
jgi:hypothetical protein